MPRVSAEPRLAPFTYCCGATFYRGPMDWLQRLLEKKETIPTHEIMAVLFRAGPKSPLTKDAIKVLPGLWLGFTSYSQWAQIDDPYSRPPRGVRIAYNLNDQRFFCRIVKDERAKANRPLLAISTSDQRGAPELLEKLDFKQVASWERGREGYPRTLTLWVAHPK